jgi:hypothetical protein
LVQTTEGWHGKLWVPLAQPLEQRVRWQVEQVSPQEVVLGRGNDVLLQLSALDESQKQLSGRVAARCHQMLARLRS